MSSKYRKSFLLSFTGLSAIGGFLFGYFRYQFLKTKNVTFRYDTGVIGGANLFIHNDISPYSDNDK